MGSTSMQDTILREVERYQQSHIQHSTAYGELDHPSYDSITFQELHMATVSHQVRDQCLQSTRRFTHYNTETCRIIKLGCLRMSNSTLQMACMECKALHVACTAWQEAVSTAVAAMHKHLYLLGRVLIG